MDAEVDHNFTRQLPKVELHAHLSGSFSKQTLHKIWQCKRSQGLCAELDDPVSALQKMPNIFTFFAIFNDYIYKLLNDVESIKEATLAVVHDFEQDGVAYLELRTTPRQISASINRRKYVETVLTALRDRPKPDNDAGIEVHIILSIDRSMTVEEANEIYQIALDHCLGSAYDKAHQHAGPVPLVLGLDLCGNPMKGNINIFTPIFHRAKASPLKTTIHFAEVPSSSTEHELTTILSWRPDRIGHVINVPPIIKARIREERIALELCLSCNMIAGMVEGTISDHHFGEWLSASGNSIALSTDDVGVFESPLSNEYLLAAQHFDLKRSEVIALSRRAVRAAFTGQERVLRLLDRFEHSVHGT